GPCTTRSSSTPRPAPRRPPRSWPRPAPNWPPGAPRSSRPDASRGAMVWIQSVEICPGRSVRQHRTRGGRVAQAEATMIGRARALLAKAEHPATPRPEAEAAHAKAAELMMRYALDEAALRAAHGEGPDPVVYWEHVASGADGHGRARCTAA